MGLLAFLMVFGYQNCGGKFEVASKSLSSLSCKPALSKTALFKDLEKEIGPVNCEDVRSYSCTVRNYSPDLSYSQSDRSLCTKSSAGSCASLKVLTFDTRSAREPSNASEFLPGGEYNHIDASCSHSLVVGGASIATGEGSDEMMALENAIASCHALSKASGSADGGVL